MREIRASLGGIIGAVAQGSETERWFLDAETGQLILISATYQDEDHIARSVEVIKNGGDRYIGLPYITHEEFLDEVRMYARTVSDRPQLEQMLIEAADKGFTKEQVKQILNRDPGQGEKFGEFYEQRVEERVQAWLENMGIKLVEE